MKYGYVYARNGAPLLSWKNGPPNQSRAADAKGLGSLGDPTITLPLPRPGSPEPVGCAGGCSGGDVVIDLTSPSFWVGAAAGYFLLTKLFGKSSSP